MVKDGWDTSDVDLQMEFSESAEQPGGVSCGYQVLRILHHFFLSTLAAIPSSGLIFYNMGTWNDFLVGLPNSSLSIPYTLQLDLYFLFFIIFYN